MVELHVLCNFCNFNFLGLLNAIKSLGFVDELARLVNNLGHDSK